MTIICVVRPDKILDELQDELSFLPTDRKGVYHRKGLIQQWIIHPDELDFIPENYPLLALSRGKKLAQFIQYCLKYKEYDFLNLVLNIGILKDADTVLKKIMEMKAMSQVITDTAWSTFDQFLYETPEARKKLSFSQTLLNEGKIILFKTMLKKRFGHLPKWVGKCLQQSSKNQLDKWTDKLFTAQTIDDVFKKA